MKYNKKTVGKVALGVLGVGGLVALSRRSKAGTVIGSTSRWEGDVKAIQSELVALGYRLDIDGKPGTQTCGAAEAAVAAGKGSAGLKAFAQSQVCGSGLPRMPCGIAGPVASEAVREAILSAAEKRGYPRGDVDKAVRRESGWKAQAVACGGSPRHAIAGGLLQFIPITLKAVGFDGSPEQFAGLPAEAQLPYLLKFLGKMPQSTLHLPGDFGLALFTPAYVGKQDDFVIYERGSLGWEQNPGLRLGGDGPITAGSVRATAR